MDQRFCLLFWYDGERSWTIQNTTTVVKPRKEPDLYNEGELVFAKFQGKLYRAAIVRVNENKHELKEDGLKLEKLLRNPDLTPNNVLVSMGVSDAELIGSKDKLKDGHKKELECDPKLPPKSVHKQMTMSNKKKKNKGKNAIQASKAKRKKICEGSDIILSTGKNAIQASKLEKKKRGDGCVENTKKEKPMTGYKQKDKSVKTLAAKRTFKEMLRGVVADDFNRYSSELSVKPYRFMNLSDSASASSIEVQSQIDVLTAERDEARLRVADLEHQVKDLQQQLEVGRKFAPPVVTPSKVDFLQRMVEFIGSKTDANTSFDYTLLKSNTRPCLEQQYQSKETYSQQSIQLFPSQQTNIDDLQEPSSFKQLLQLTPDKQASTDELNSTHKQLTFTDQSIQQQTLTQSSHQQPMQQMHYQQMSAQLAQYTSTPNLQLTSQSLQQFAFEQPIEISRSTEQPWIQEQYSDWQQDYQHEYEQKDNFFQHNRSLDVNNYCPDKEESDVPASAVDEEWSSPVTKCGDRKVPLVDGAEVYITKQQKSRLAICGFHKPRKAIIHILDTLFDQKRLAGMSALGSRSAPNKKAGPMTRPVPQQVKNAIKDYITDHFESSEVSKTLKDLNRIINSKCGTARRYLNEMI